MKIGMLFVTVSALFLLWCSPAPTSITGTETGNGSSGIVSFIDGKPANGAKVMLVPSFYEELNPPERDFMIVSTATDSCGRFKFRNLFEGYYNIFCEKDGYKSYIDSLLIADTFTLTGNIILKKPGSLSGVSYYSSGSFPLNSYIVVTGSRYYSRINDKSGSFILPALPAGIYKAKISSPSSDYFDKTFTFSITENSSDTLHNPVLLVSNYVTSLIPAFDSSLWVGTTNGLIHITDSAKTVFGLHDGLTSSHITCIGQSIDSSIWVGTLFRLARFNNLQLISNYDFIGSIKTINVKTIRTNAQGEIWFGTTNGLYLHYNGEWQEIKFARKTDILTVSTRYGNEFSDISSIEFQGHRMLIGTHHGLFIRDSNGNWNTDEQLKNISVNDLAVIDSNSFLVGTSRGLFGINSGECNRINFSEQVNTVTCLLCLDTLWFIGTENGLFLYKDNIWSEIDIQPLNGYVTSIAQDLKNRVWVGTSNGLCRYHNNKIEIIE